MTRLAFDPTRKSLFQPGEADDFFQLSDSIVNPEALCVEMARLAYVKQVARLSAYLSRIGYLLHGTWGYGEPGTQAFIATSEETARMVVAFRGTEPDDPSDIVTDAKLLKSTWFDRKRRPIGYVHVGFANALLKDVGNDSVLSGLDEEIRVLSHRYEQVMLTGHSLGAALATLTAAYYLNSPLMKKITLITFGSPLVGDGVFAANMGAVDHRRFVNCSDLVTRIPPTQFGYRHSGELKYIDRNGQLIDVPEPDLISQDRMAAMIDYLIHHSFLPGTVWGRELADHSPINYVSGVNGIRVQLF